MNDIYIISNFSDIVIKLFFQNTKKHEEPHIYAQHATQVGVYSILNQTRIAGNMNLEKEKLIIEWIKINKEDLIKNWQRASMGEVPFEIEGLTV